MDFLNKLGKKASETYQVTKEKTVKFSEEMKLKGKINEARSTISDLYSEIGEYVYNSYKTNIDEGKEEIETRCRKISDQFDEIAKLEAEILALKSVKKCVDCGAELKREDGFCSKCGKQQPKQEEKVEVTEESEIQDVQDAEVTAIKDTEEAEQAANVEAAEAVEGAAETEPAEDAENTENTAEAENAGELDSTETVEDKDE